MIYDDMFSHFRPAFRKKIIRIIRMYSDELPSNQNLHLEQPSEEAFLPIQAW